MNIISANGHPEAFQMVETGRAVAFVMDDILLYSLVAQLAQPEGVRDLAGGALGRALRHHAAQGRRGVQEGRRQRDDADLQVRRDQRDLRQVVPEADPAQGHQPQRADERRSSRRSSRIRPTRATRRTTSKPALQSGDYGSPVVRFEGGA